jgi:Na+/H+ antiporter NhaC
MLVVDDHTTKLDRPILPGWIALLPPLIAIVLAIVFRQVVLSLFLGIWVGCFFIYGLRPATALFRAVDTIIVDSMLSRSHIEIILFSLMLGGMVGLITRNGGTRGIINRMKAISTSIRRGQVATWAMGIFIFFDDYANSLIVGNTMRPITDRLKISREKLSYIVDATAAPVSSLAIISTWIGFEIGLIGDAIGPLELDVDPYILFLETIPYRFYPILSLFFVLLISITGRDFGPMLKAERRSYQQGKVKREGSTPLSDFEGDMIAPPDGTPLRWINAILPIFVVIFTTVLGLWYDGCHQLISMGINPSELPLRKIVTEADTFDVLLWASTLGVLSAMILSLAQRIMTVSGIFEAWIAGIRSMLLAMIVLILAWSLGSVCEKIGTAGYVINISRGLFSPMMLPALTFLISAVISFSTGTSWATMAIVIPIVTPLSYNLSQSAGFPMEEIHLNMVSTLSGVLAGSIFGDHCSPISDTTILSSMASSVDHVDHVRTQLPYALLVGFVGVILGDIPTAYGLSPYISLVVCCLVLVVFLRIFGKKV